MNNTKWKINWRWYIFLFLFQQVRCLSPRMQRRGFALISAFSTAMLILSNLVFLGGIHVGRIFWKRMFVQGLSFKYIHLCVWDSYPSLSSPLRFLPFETAENLAAAAEKAFQLWGNVKVFGILIFCGLNVAVFQNINCKGFMWLCLSFCSRSNTHKWKWILSEVLRAWWAESLFFVARMRCAVDHKHRGYKWFCKIIVLCFDLDIHRVIKKQKFWSWGLGM